MLSGLLAACASAPPEVVTSMAPPPEPPPATIDTHIQEASQRFNVPEVWIRAVMMQESGGRTHLNGRPVVSRKGAMGLMQIMPSTWSYLREQHNLGNDPFDPRDNILAGTAYLRELYNQFGVPGFLAAYNAGPGRYEKHLRTRRPLPGETRHYVAKISPQIAGIEPGTPAAPASAAPAPAAVAVAQAPASAPVPASAVPAALASAPAIPAAVAPVPAPPPVVVAALPPVAVPAEPAPAAPAAPAMPAPVAAAPAALPAPVVQLASLTLDDSDEDDAAQAGSRQIGGKPVRTGGAVRGASAALGKPGNAAHGPVRGKTAAPSHSVASAPRPGIKPVARPAAKSVLLAQLPRG